jgi:hypothetical protein
MALESNLSDESRGRKRPYLGFPETEHGYLDTLFDILDAHDHPCVLLGEWAIRWMEAGPIPFGVSPSTVLIFHCLTRVT